MLNIQEGVGFVGDHQYNPNKNSQPQNDNGTYKYTHV
jgi:hypothetical protein